MVLKKCWRISVNKTNIQLGYLGNDAKYGDIGFRFDVGWISR